MYLRVSTCDIGSVKIQSEKPDVPKLVRYSCVFQYLQSICIYICTQDLFENGESSTAHVRWVVTSWTK